MRRGLLQKIGGEGLLLDTYGGASAAYSLRYLSSAFVGNDVVLVRRSSDNAELGFTPTEITNGTLTTWVGAGNDGFIKTWYDQSGNSNDGTQTVLASQPLIVNAGVLESESDFGNNAIYFDGVDDFFDVNKILTPPNVFIVASKINGTIRGTYIGGSATQFVRSDANYDMANTSSISTGTQTNTLDLIYANNITSEIGLNGATASVGSIGQGNYVSLLTIGQKASVNYLMGYYCELIIYEINNASNRTGIEANINAYYTIY